MAFCDFVVKYDPTTETKEALTKKIIYTLFYKRIKGKKPVVCFIGGDSGEGKSWACLKLQEVILSYWNITLDQYLNYINVYSPLQYPYKIDALLNDAELKDIHIIAMHEARDLVRAKKWYSFLNEAIGDINTQSRSVKRMVIFIISQFIRDISTDIRYSLTYYCKATRPIGKKTRLYINVIWKDDHDLEKPKLRKRKISGYLVDNEGRYRRYVPKYLILDKPSDIVIKEFERQDREAKATILKKKISKLMEEMKKDIGEESAKVLAMVEYYSKNTETLNTIGKRKGKYWYLNADFKKMHGLSEDETKDFQKALNIKLTELKII